MASRSILKRLKKPGKITRFIQPAILLALLVVPFFFPVHTGAQEESGISLSAQAGLGGYCKDGYWIPVRVVVENQGRGLEGHLEVRIPGSNNQANIYAQTVSLPTVSRKEFLLYVYPSGYVSQLDLRLVSGNRPVAETTLPVTCANPGSPLYGVLAAHPSPFNLLSAADPSGRSASIADLDLLALPDRAQALMALDLLVISSVETARLTPDQKEALSGWLANGGRLVVTGGPEWEKTAAGIRDWLPLLPEDSLVLPDKSEEGNRNSGSPGRDSLPQGVVIATGDLQPDSQVLAWQGDQPVITRKPFGSGAVIYLAFDPSVEPLRSYTGLVDLFARVIETPQEKPVWASGFQEWTLATEAVGTLPNLDLPSGWLIIGFLGAYVVAIGPVHFLILRRSKRRELAWFSIPVLVLVFSSISFIMGIGVRGARPVINQLAVVQVWPGVEKAQLNGIVGVFSPRRGSYQLFVDPNLLVHPLPSRMAAAPGETNLFLKDDQGGTQVSDIRVDVGGIQPYAVDGLVPAPLFVSDLGFNLSETQAVLQGEITNQSDLMLQDAVLLGPGKTQNLGDFSPGETRPIQITVDSGSRATFAGPRSPNQPMFYTNSSASIWTDLLGTRDYYVDREIYRRYTLLNAITGYGYGNGGRGSGIYLAGWSDGAPITARLQVESAKTYSNTLYVVALDPQVSIARGMVTLPPGLMTWSVLAPGSMGEAAPYDTYLNPGGYSLRFKPALPVRIQSVESLTLHLKSPGAAGPANIEAQLWDYTTGNWESLPVGDWGDYDVASPERFVDPGGEIRLRLDNTNFGQVQIEAADFTLVVNQE